MSKQKKGSYKYITKEYVEKKIGEFFAKGNLEPPQVTSVSPTHYMLNGPGYGIRVPKEDWNRAMQEAAHDLLRELGKEKGNSE